MVVVLDCGFGNPGSVLNMIKRVGGNAVISSDPRIVSDASKIILPGVGSFDNGVRRLKESDFYSVLEDKVVRQGVPFLGICLGMQMLFQSSEEGTMSGLGWINGHVKRFDFKGKEDSNHRIPHMGWNVVISAKENKLLPTQENGLRYYFVHFYHVVPANESDVLGYTSYGYEFASAVQRNNIFGVQFHPEKSHRYGMALIENFLSEELC